MIAIEGGIYCQECVGRLTGRTPIHLAVRFPASHKEDKETCRGCGKTIELHKASKVIRRKE